VKSTRTIVSKLLFGHVLLRRDKGGSLCVTLAERNTSPAPATPDDEAARLVATLKQALDARPASRRTFKHLHYLESSLKKNGLRALPEAPRRILLKALTQLDALGTPSAPGRALLRERLAAEVVARSPDPAAPTEPETCGLPSDFLVAHKLQVTDGRLSDFIRAADGPDTVPRRR
jgi:hypothetical protein